MRIGITGPIKFSPLVPYLSVEDGKAPPLPSGIGGTSPVNLAIELLERGEQVSIYTLDHSIEEYAIYTGSNLRIHVGPYRIRPRNRAMDWFRAERRAIQQMIQSEPPDIVHAQWTYEFALAAIDSGVPYLVTARDAPYSILKHQPTIYRAIRLGMAHRAVARAKSMTGVSTYIKRHLERYFPGCPPITVVPNGLPQSLLPLRTPLVDSTSRPLTFATSIEGWANLKNAKAALRAFQMARREFADSSLLMFGSGYGPQEAAFRWASENGLTKGVEFVGATKYERLIRELAARVDVLVHPSLDESFSMAALEAMALGIPVVGGNRSGAVPSTVGPKAGLLVDVRNPSELADAMCRLGRSRDLRLEMGAAGAKRARERFSMSSVVNSYMKIYQSILDNAGRFGDV